MKDPINAQARLGLCTLVSMGALYQHSSELQRTHISCKAGLLYYSKEKRRLVLVGSLFRNPDSDPSCHFVQRTTNIPISRAGSKPISHLPRQGCHEKRRGQTHRQRRRAPRQTLLMAAPHQVHQQSPGATAASKHKKKRKKRCERRRRTKMPDLAGRETNTERRIFCTRVKSKQDHGASLPSSTEKTLCTVACSFLSTVGS